MAVGFDASSESHAATGSVSQASFNWNHTPSGTPKGVLVFVFVTTSTSDIISSVTYGGVAMSAVSGGRAVDTAAETGSCKAYFLGSGIPTGVQSVVVNRSNTANAVYAVAITVTADGNTETTGVVLLQNDGTYTEQSVDDGSPGSNSMRFAGAYYGGANPAGNGASSTPLQDLDFGNFGASVVRETTAGQGSRSVGFSAGSDDRAAVHLAIREIIHATTPTDVTSSPVVGSPAITQDHVTAATGTTAAPVVGAPALTQNHALDLTGVTAAPVVGAPTATQDAVNHSTTPTGVTAAPEVGSPSIGQDHATAPAGITAAPTVGAPAVTQDHALALTGVAAGAPSVGSPALTQAHDLAPVGAVSGAPEVGTPAVTQDHALAPDGVTTAPDVPDVVVSSDGSLLMQGIVTAPVMGTPAITQDHAIVPTGVSSGPVMDAPAAVIDIPIAPVGVAAAPQVGLATLSQDHFLAVVELVAGAPVVGQTDVTEDVLGNVALVPAGILAGPVVGAMWMRDRPPHQTGTGLRGAAGATVQRGGIVATVKRLVQSTTVRRT